jgi:hypothetical protein
MFRSYARVGIVTSLCVDLLAGCTVAALSRGSNWALAERPYASTRNGRGRRAALWLAGIALALTALEYWPLPPLAHDVLPTRAHRWLAERPGAVRALDCVGRSQAEALVPWLMRKDLRPVGPPFEGCNDADLVPKLAALDFTHLVSRAAQPALWPDSQVPDGLRRAAAYAEASVYEVTAGPPPIVVLDSAGFFSWERAGSSRWRWIGQDAGWTVFNTTPAEIHAALRLQLEAFATPRHVIVELDARPVSTIDVGIAPREYFISPVLLPSGRHVLRFRVREPATRAADVLANGDQRLLTIRFYLWRWEVVAR